jgi:hypothetical protein
MMIEKVLKVFGNKLVDAHTLENLAVAVALTIPVYSIYGVRS